ncbi:MAG: hypothetical protein QXE23_08670 [Nitrososphaerota archaeon]
MIGVERVVESWPEYGIIELYLSWNGEPIPWKAIVKRGKLVHIASRRYTVLPLEVSVKAADLAASKIGAAKISELYNDEETRVYALYDLGRDVSPVKGVETRLGMYVYNSIDGTLSFGASVMSIMTKRGSAFYAFIPPTRLATYLSPEAAVAIVRHPHTPGLSEIVANLSARLEKLVERGLEAVAVYRLWAEISVDKDIASSLISRLPKAYLPAYIRAMKDGVTLKELVTVWDAYVDISSKIWRGDASIDRKIDLYRMLYEALPRPPADK